MRSACPSRAPEERVAWLQKPLRDARREVATAFERRYLGALLEEKYRRFAFKSIEYYSAKLAKTPIYYPYLFNQALRHFREERIVKASAQKLRALPRDAITYPFLLLKAEPGVEAYLVCGTESCFATTDSAEELDALLKRSLRP